jgi:hypothetical protein
MTSKPPNSQKSSKKRPVTLTKHVTLIKERSTHPLLTDKIDIAHMKNCGDKIHLTTSLVIVGCTKTNFIDVYWRDSLKLLKSVY